MKPVPTGESEVKPIWSAATRRRSGRRSSVRLFPSGRSSTAPSTLQGDRLRPDRSVTSHDTTERWQATALQIGESSKSSQFGVRRLDAALDEGQASDCSHQADPARHHQRFEATGCVLTAWLQVTTQQSGGKPPHSRLCEGSSRRSNKPGLNNVSTATIRTTETIDQRSHRLPEISGRNSFDPRRYNTASVAFHKDLPTPSRNQLAPLLRRLIP